VRELTRVRCTDPVPGKLGAEGRKFLMVSIIIGLVLFAAAIFEWVGHVSVIHAIAILTGLLGVVLVLYGVVAPVHWRRQL
jgi:predicted phage tail protein